MKSIPLPPASRVCTLWWPVGQWVCLQAANSGIGSVFSLCPWDALTHHKLTEWFSLNRGGEKAPCCSVSRDLVIQSTFKCLLTQNWLVPVSRLSVRLCLQSMISILLFNIKLYLRFVCPFGLASQVTSHSGTSSPMVASSASVTASTSL